MTFAKITATAAVALLLAACSNNTMMSEGDSMDKMDKTAETMEAPVVAEAPMEESTAGTVMVGGVPMSSDRNIVENAATSPDLSTLVAAVQAAELVDTLSGPGPFTVFAPVNSAFDALPAGTVDTLLQPENKADLQGVLTYHVVPGTFDAAAILAQKGDNLSTSFATAQGGSLTVSPAGDDIYVIDSKGNAARVIQSDVYQSNGVVHVIDAVLLP